MIDLRSDTVTQPTPAMRRAMAEAELGDDVYGEDPTVNRLQDLVAEMTGFEAGLFVPSGTMGNLVALAAHTRRGAEVIAPEGAHLYEAELGGLAAVGGLVPRLVSAPRGAPTAAAVRAAIGRSVHRAPTGLVVLENSHNHAGGTMVPLERCREIGAVAHEEGLPLHLDGARAFNAAVALGVTIGELCDPFDSASLCLSKGLAAPVGTVVVGARGFIREAHRYRKMFGGGMRQAGVLAAAGLVAVGTMVERLAEDHARARAMAERLARLPGLTLDLGSVHTNMIYFRVEDAPGLVARLGELGVRCNASGADSVRLVTHYQIRDEDADRAVELIAELLERRAQGAGTVVGSAGG